MIYDVIKAGINAFTSWNSNRQEIKKQKIQNKKELMQLDHKVKVANVTTRLRMAESGQIQTYNLDMQTVKDMGKTLKDEFILFTFYAPILLAFFGYKDKVFEGFAAIEKMPDWYVLIIVLLAVSISGVRGMFTKTLEVLGSKFSLRKANDPR